MEEVPRVTDEEFNSKAEVDLYKKFYRKIVKDLEKNGRLIKGSSDGVGEEVDKMKFKKLITDYKDFKRNNVRHFKFNSASDETSFGQFLPALIPTHLLFQEMKSIQPSS